MENTNINYETKNTKFYNTKGYEEEMNEIYNMTREEVRSENIMWEEEDIHMKRIERNKKCKKIEKDLSKIYKDKQEVRSRISLFLSQSDF